MAVAVSDLVSSSPGSRLPCTPVNFVSPALRRRGLLDGGAGVNKSPLAQSVTANAMLEMNDDEAEKRERRLSKAMEMQQQLLSSPVVQSDRCRSAFNHLVNQNKLSGFPFSQNFWKPGNVKEFCTGQGKVVGKCMKSGKGEGICVVRDI